MAHRKDLPMGEQKGLSWINPRYLARASASPADLMLAGAAELLRRWKDGGWDVSVEEVLAVRQTLSAITELLCEDELMPGFMADLTSEGPIERDADERTRKAGHDAARAARELTAALGHVETDPGQLRALVRRGS
jgi:hypothetical protein